MAAVSFFDGLENVLVVTGDDVYDMSRSELTDFLHTTNTSPRNYRDGLYDFTFLWWNGRSGNASHNTWNPATSPRPNRGRIYMPGVPSSSTANALGRVTFTMLHEVLHHWMVDSEMTVGGSQIPQNQDFVSKATNGEISFSEPPMLARQNSHWSPYWQSDDSVLDGTAYSIGPRLGGLRRWDPVTKVAYSFDIDGITISPTTKYSDLDLLAMGAKSEAECYPDDNGRFRWMEPRFVGPIGFRMGAIAAVRGPSGVTTYEFGYQDDFDKVVIVEDGQTLEQRQIPNFDPFTLVGAGLVYRIVLSGGRLHFDLRVDTRSAEGCLNAILSILSLNRRSGPDFDFFDPLLNLPTSGDFRQWTRVHSVKLDSLGPTGDLEIVVGLNSQKWESGWTDLTFQQPKLRMRTPTGSTSTRELDIAFGPADRGAGTWLDDWDSWPAGTARNFLPTSGTEIWRDSTKRLHFTLPHRMFDGTEWVTVDPDEFVFDPPGNDGGARVLWKAPDDFFAFATSAAPGYALVVPWIGGGMNDKYLLGIEHLTPVTEVDFPGIPALKRASPPNQTYKVAHIIVAKEASDVTVEKVRAVDTRRRCLDLAFEQATQGRRFMDSSLEPA